MRINELFSEIYHLQGNLNMTAQPQVPSSKLLFLATLSDSYQLPSIGLIESISFLPGLFVACMFVTCAVTVLISVCLKQVNTKTPILCNAGANIPAYYVFAPGLALSSVLLLLTVSIASLHQYQLASLVSCTTTQVLSIFGFVFGGLASIGLALMGSVNFNLFPTLHNVCAYLYIFACLSFQLFQASSTVTLRASAQALEQEVGFEVISSAVLGGKKRTIWQFLSTILSILFSIGIVILWQIEIRRSGLSRKLKRDLKKIQAEAYQIEEARKKNLRLQKQRALQTAYQQILESASVDTETPTGAKQNTFEEKEGAVEIVGSDIAVSNVMSNIPSPSSPPDVLNVTSFLSSQTNSSYDTDGDAETTREPGGLRNSEMMIEMSSTRTSHSPQQMQTQSLLRVTTVQSSRGSLSTTTNDTVDKSSLPSQTIGETSRIAFEAISPFPFTSPVNVSLCGPQDAVSLEPGAVLAPVNVPKPQAELEQEYQTPMFQGLINVTTKTRWHLRVWGTFQYVSLAFSLIFFLSLIQNFRHISLNIAIKT